MITDKQCRVLRKEYARTQNMSVSAMKAGVDRKTARKYLNTEQTPAEQRQAHDWRTRVDPLARVWPQAEAMLMQAPELEAKALFEHLLDVPGSDLKETHLRTFQRRVQRWRGTHGPEREVMFDQRRHPGDLLQVDWTHPGDLAVSVQGQPLAHLLCHGVLAYSNWQWAVRCQSESFLSLVGTLQACFARLGKVPRCVSTDNSSAATHEIVGGKRGYNLNYLEVCTHFNFEPLTINVGCPHEHGDVESANRHLKRRLDQHLLLRGSRDFESAQAYDQFVSEVLEKANGRRSTLLDQELAAMRAIPGSWLAEYRELRVRVSSQSTIRVRNVSYSVPSRLIGHELRVEQYEAELKVYLGRELVVTLPRQSSERGAVIDFRHVVGPLLRKPGAFANYQHREQLYPSADYRAAHDRLVADHGPRQGVVEYLQVLRVAGEHGVEPVAARLASWLSQSGKWTALALALELAPKRAEVIHTPELVPEFGSYDELLGSGVNHVG
jgi:hypothetical protein